MVLGKMRRVVVNRRAKITARSSARCRVDYVMGDRSTLNTLMDESNPRYERFAAFLPLGPLDTSFSNSTPRFA